MPLNRAMMMSYVLKVRAMAVISALLALYAASVNPG